jgi:hypothetical protein
MIKRFKFLVIILVASIYSVINCSGFEENLNNAIRLYNDFSKLTPEQEACYLPQIDKIDCRWIPIDYACFNGNVSAFRWLLSKGVVPTQKCFDYAMGRPSSKIVSDLLILGLYTEHIGKRRTLQKVQTQLVCFSELATRDPYSFASSLAETQMIYEMIKRYEDEVGLRTE